MLSAFDSRQRHTLLDKNSLSVGRKIRESGLCVKFNLHTPYCGWGIGAKFLDEIGTKADEFWTGI